MKTTFKDIAHHYLGTGLECRDIHTTNEGIITNISVRGQSMSIGWGYQDYSRFKPLLRPLSSLTDREIEILDGLHDFSHLNFDQIKINPLRYPFVIFEQLLAWHFNCFSLDESEFIAITH